MEGENYFFPKQEQKEVLSQSYSIKFDQSRFGDSEIDPVIKTWNENHRCGWLPGAIKDWWKEICREKKLNSAERIKFSKSYDILLELGKNAFEYAGGGEIKVIFEPNRITIVVADEGSGFENPNNNMSKHHGLFVAKRYADEFIIETNGNKFSKSKDQKYLIETKDTDVRNGSKITFIKNFK